MYLARWVDGNVAFKNGEHASFSVLEVREDVSYRMRLLNCLRNRVSIARTVQRQTMFHKDRMDLSPYWVLSTSLGLVNFQFSTNTIRGPESSRNRSSWDY